MVVRGQITNEAFWNASGRIQAAGSGGVATAAPNADNMVEVHQTPETKRSGGGQWWDGMGRDKHPGRLRKEKGPLGCTRRKT